MSAEAKFTEYLSERAMPELAAALRQRCEAIMLQWTDAVAQNLPDADPLTASQVRDTIPIVLAQLARALESDQPTETRTYLELTTAHGATRFHQSYDIAEMVVEYRLLRRILINEMNSALHGRLSLEGHMALNTGVDLALQQSVAAFVQHQSEQLRIAVELQAKYLSYLSHDLRNNLNSILLQLDVLNYRLKPLPDFAEDVGEIESLQRSIRETFGGMDRLLQAERLRKKAVQPRLVNVDLRSVVQDVIVQHSRMAGEKNLKLENGVPPGVGVTSDAELLALVLQNLVGNAIKYSNRGTVRVHSQQQVPHQRWLLSVTDEGPGIAPDKLAQLFEAFNRGETFGQKGVGLGLTIAYEAARVLGSELTVQSQVGHGTTFSMTLPQAQP